MLRSRPYDGLRMHFGVAFLASSLAIFMAVPAGGFEPELPFLVGDTALGSAAGNQEAPDIERGSDLYLAVWIDYRTTVPSDSPEYATGADVYAARLDAAGNLLDSTPIVVAEDIADQLEARASWNGQNWLVTWYSRTPGPSHPYPARGMQSTRISPAGELLDNPPIDVYPSPSGSVEYLATGSDGTDWVVFLSETVQVGMNTETYLKGARISPSGTLLGAPVVLYHPSCCYFFPLGTDVAYAQDEYLLVFECIPSIYVNDAICGMRFTPSLQKIDTHPFEIAGTSGVFREPQVATNGTDFLVGWYHYVTPPWPPVLVNPYCARVTHDGQSLDPDGIELSGGTGAGDARLPRVAWGGTNWIAAWPDDDGARVARITPAGVVLDPGGVSFPDLSVGAIGDSPAGGFRLAWADDRSGGEQPLDVYSTYVSEDLIADSESSVSRGAPTDTYVDVAVGDADGMLVFRSDVSGERRIMAQPEESYSGGGGGDPSLLASGPAVGDPGIAWNGSLYFAIWSDETEEMIYGRRLAADGTVLDDPPIAVMSGLEPDVAAVGDDFLVVGTDATGGPTVRKPFGVRVRGSDGAVLDGTPILLGESYARVPAVAGMILRWLVTWERHPSAGNPEATVWAAFVDPDGSTPGEFGVATNLATSEYHGNPAIGAGPGLALIVWEESRVTRGEDWNLYARRVQFDGAVFDDPDGLEVVTDTLDQRNAAVGWGGSDFLVAYEVTEQIGWFDHSLSNIHGTRVSQAGFVLYPVDFTIAGAEHAEILPAVADAAYPFVVATSLFKSGAPYASYRIEVLEVEEGVSGIPQAPMADASSAIRLLGTYPNPAASSIRIALSIGEPAPVSVRIYDVRGRLVRKFTEAVMPAGAHDFGWDGRDDSGNSVATGVYLCRVDAGGEHAVGKLAILR